jgi:hypothetical protein
MTNARQERRDIVKKYIGCALLLFSASNLPLLAAGTVPGGPPAGEKPLSAAEVQAKRDLAETIVRDLRRTFGKDLDPRYRANLMRDLLALPLAELERRAAAERGPLTKALGDTTDDLVYTPMTPCRIFDSRSGSGLQGAGTGPLAAGAAVAIDVAGGAAASCGVPFPAAKAAVLNFIAVAPSGPGDLRAWPWDNTNPPPPNASVINFSNVAGLNIANGPVVPICNTSTATGGDCTHDLFLRPDVHSTHVVIDVLGYLAAPVATALDCQRVSSPFSAAIGTQFNVASGSCPAGYTLTGGGIELGTAWTSGDELLGTNPFSDAWQCLGYNGGGNTWSGNCWALCCRVPGR